MKHPERAVLPANKTRGVGPSLSRAAAARKKKVSDTAVVWVLLSLMGGCLLVIQYATLPRIKNFILLSSLGDHTQVIRKNAVKLFIDNWPTILTPFDLFTLSLLGILILALAASEIFGSRLALFLARLGGSRKSLLLFLLLASVLITRYYLNPGNVFMGDSETYTVRSWMVAEHVRNIQLPVWSNYWYGGFPLLQYYAPLLFVVIALFYLVFQDIDVATKVVLWTSHIGSVFVMFYFLREVIRNELSSLLGALAYALIFHRVYIVLYQGDLHLSLVFLLYPLILFITEKFLNRGFHGRKAFVSLTLTISALILTHHAYAFFGLVFFAVYLFVRVCAAGSFWTARLRTLLFFALSGIAAFLVSAFSLLPFILGLQEVRGLPKIPFHLLLPALPSLEALRIVLEIMLRWTPVGHNGNVTYVGISLLLFFLLSAAYVIKARKVVGLGFLVCAAVSFLTLKSDTMYNVKNFNFVVFFIAALSVYTPDAVRWILHGSRVGQRLEKRWGRLFEAKLALVPIALLVLDLGPTTFQSVYNERGDFKSAVYEGLMRHERNYKVIERPSIQYNPQKNLRENFDPTKLGIPSVHAPVQTPLGWFHEGSPRSISYNTEMVKKLQLDLHEGTISDLSLKGLYLMGVKFVLFRDRYHYFAPPLMANPHYSVKDLYVELNDIRPLLVSTKLLHVKDIPNYAAHNIIERGAYFDGEMYNFDTPYYDQIVKPLIEAMNIDLNRGSADYLILRDDRIPQNAATSPDKFQVQVNDFSVSIDSVSLKYVSTGDGFARFPYSYFPYLDVRVDGKETPFFRSAMHDIVVPVYLGEHTVRILGRASPLSRWTFFLSVGSIIVIILIPSRILNYFNHR